jgi:hypothetical protein
MQAKLSDTSQFRYLPSEYHLGHRYVGFVGSLNTDTASPMDGECYPQAKTCSPGRPSKPLYLFWSFSDTGERPWLQNHHVSTPQMGAVYWLTQKKLFALNKLLLSCVHTRVAFTPKHRRTLRRMAARLCVVYDRSFFDRITPAGHTRLEMRSYALSSPGDLPVLTAFSAIVLPVSPIADPS